MFLAPKMFSRPPGVMEREAPFQMPFQDRQGYILHHCEILGLGFHGGSLVKSEPMQETQVHSLGQEGPLEEEVATHSSVLAWEILWIEEPDWLKPMGSPESDMTVTNQQ